MYNNYWVVKIEGTTRERIFIEYDFSNDVLIFKAQYRFLSWEAIVTDSLKNDSYNDLAKIQEMMYNVVVKMREKIKKYNEFNEAFDTIKLIEINE